MQGFSKKSMQWQKNIWEVVKKDTLHGEIILVHPNLGYV